MDKSEDLILWFDEVGIEDVPLVGGKNASLGEMYQILTKKGVNIPGGFCVTAEAYRYFMKVNDLNEKIYSILKNLNTHDLQQLEDTGRKIRAMIRNAKMPEILEQEIFKAYQVMGKKYGENTDVAVRSSATAEDLPDASFAGQQETYLNVRGKEELIESCKKCFASLYTNRAISYRVDKGFKHENVALSIGVQKMVRSDKSCSGVMFSIDTESGFKDVVFITGIYGLGENIVQGKVNPDEYYVFKPTLERGFKPIIQKSLGDKKIKMIYSKNGNKLTKNVVVPKEDRSEFVLTDEEVLTLAKWSVIIEDHYSAKAGKFKPMDMEWAKDGIDGKLYVVQARPETVQSQKDVSVVEDYELKEKGKVLVEGKSIGSKIGFGDVNVIKDPDKIKNFKKGQVLVTDMTDPDWEPIMKIASAIVTNKGGRTCHAAIVSRELGIPAVVGTNDATKILKNRQIVTVSCAEGEKGFVYSGKVPFKIERHKINKIPKTNTKIMMNVGNPSRAFEFSFLPNEGVGLAREEFIINSFIGIHPNAILYPDKIDSKTKNKIKDTIKPYKDGKEFYVDKLAEGIGMIAAAFYPKPVILRFSDFKSNEYKNLVGGEFFEPEEDNPMIGWRGSSRYYSKDFKKAFSLECKAVKKVREVFGLTNLYLMVPFCRTLDEAKLVLKELKNNKLERGKDGLKVMMMCEVPSNVILADKFLDLFDGFSIGSNDLTQLTLGVDRDSELIAHIYDERNEAVKRMLEQVIDVANKKGKYIGICGQAPSDYPEIAKFIVKKGIKSISLNPDSVIETTLLVSKEEKKK